MRCIRYLNTVLTVIAVLLTLQVWTQWTDKFDDATVSTAEASGIPNAGAQRLLIVDELKLLNKQMSKLMELFQDGSARVRLEAGK